MPAVALNVDAEVRVTAMFVIAAAAYRLYSPAFSVEAETLTVCEPEVWMPVKAMLVPTLVSVLPACTLMLDVPVVNAQR